MARKPVKGVGVPTGLESIDQSNPGFNQQVGRDQFIKPEAGLSYTRKSISTFDIDLATTVTLSEIRQNGTFIYYGSAVDSSNAALIDRPILIRFDRRNSDPVRMLPGMMLSGFPFDRIFVSVPTGYDAGDIGQLIVTVDAPDDRVRAE